MLGGYAIAKTLRMGSLVTKRPQSDLTLRAARTVENPIALSHAPSRSEGVCR